MSSKTLNIPVARVFKPLLTPARYKAAYGGRGSGKSHFFAEQAVLRSLEGGFRLVCIREVQKSLKESAKRLIEDKLQKFGLGEDDGFRVLHDRIETPGDGLIIFQGMQDHNAESVKSLESYNAAWVEEAQSLSTTSLRLLRPTIRADGSELWFSWNPRRKQDPVDAMFRGDSPPTDSVIVRANWNHNPWFPVVLEQERQDCLKDNPEQYDHIWEGGYITVASGAYFARHLAEAALAGRITHVAPDPLMTYRVFVDIGGTGARADAFAMWVCQFIGPEIRVLDYYEAQGQDLATHLGWLRFRKYSPDNTQLWLPHDGATHDRVYSVSYQSAFEQAGYKVTIVPNQGKGAAAKRIEEVRRLFPNIWFNADTTEPGREALGWYHERRNEATGAGLGPEHDWASHASDAFGLMALTYRKPETPLQEIDFAGWGS
jgi:phage terminase large subunit